ncbi:hypothetical protein K505DRAFT_12102 [Melanomma pulvis-pyrius CBS 109.77]|uniref:Uncharacterized protein n=1 Tax=Melanomma pulvis-pyrius CBS 109.77 TaxID=1314802 RepID=A0A6A6XUZ3_9PLEO|nr:hypothetical protein K505DRAFT_12102 [Melanomma pulvis-pyrius CBS 109.77]
MCNWPFFLHPVWEKEGYFGRKLSDGIWDGSIEGQLGRLLVIASLDPRLWAEKRANERKLVDVEARQFDGLVIQDAVAPRCENGGERRKRRRCDGTVAGGEAVCGWLEERSARGAARGEGATGARREGICVQGVLDRRRRWLIAVCRVQEDEWSGGERGSRPSVVGGQV